MVAANSVPTVTWTLCFSIPNKVGKSLELLKETMTREIFVLFGTRDEALAMCLREIKEALIESQKDIRNKNSMLDARFLWGEKSG